MTQDLIEWGDWKRNEDSTCAAADRQRLSARVHQMELSIAALPETLRQTVTEVYVGPGSIADHVRRLGCHESTIARRLGRIHLLIADGLDTRRDLDRQEQHRRQVAAQLLPRDTRDQLLPASPPDSEITTPNS